MKVVPDFTRPTQVSSTTPSTGDEATLLVLHKRPHLVDSGWAFRAPQPRPRGWQGVGTSRTVLLLRTRRRRAQLRQEFIQSVLPAMVDIVRPLGLDARSIAEQAGMAARGPDAPVFTSTVPRLVPTRSPGPSGHHPVRLVWAARVPRKTHVAEVGKSTHGAHAFAPFEKHH